MISSKNKEQLKIKCLFYKSVADESPSGCDFSADGNSGSWNDADWSGKFDFDGVLFYGDDFADVDCGAYVEQ